MEARKSKHHIHSLQVWRMIGLMRDGTGKSNSRDQTLRREEGQGKIHFPFSADHLVTISVDAQSADVIIRIHQQMVNFNF